MKFIIANDFFSDFEVIEAPTYADAEVYIVDMLNHNEPSEDIKVLSSSENDSQSLEEWQAETDGTLFVSDYETE